MSLETNRKRIMDVIIKIKFIIYVIVKFKILSYAKKSSASLQFNPLDYGFPGITSAVRSR